MSNSLPFVNLVVLRSNDIDKAAKFYEQLGIELTKHRHGSGPEHYSSETNGLVFEIYPLNPKHHPTTSTRVGFTVDDVDALSRRLETAGGKIISAPKDSEWGRRAVIKDLDGHSIELISPNTN